MCFWQKKIKYFSVNGLNSNHSVLKYGVPQGSVLGFILLLMNIIIIIFVLMSVFHACMSWTVSYEKDFQSFLSLVMSLLTFLSFISFLITSFHILLGHSLEKLLLTLKVLHLEDQALSSILSGWSNHCSLLPCKHSFMLQKNGKVFTANP